MKYKELLFIPIIFFIIGCASGARITITKASNDNIALLYVYRPSCPPTSLEPTIFINDIEVADLYNNGYIFIDLKPGKHIINIKWSFISGVRPQSTIIDIMARPGTVYYVRVYTHVKMVNNPLSPRYISESDADIIEENESLSLLRNYKPIETRSGIDNMIIPK